MKPYSFVVAPEQVAALFNLYRDLGSILDNIQPGLVYDPNDDGDSADAQILINLADALRGNALRGKP